MDAAAYATLSLFSHLASSAADVTGTCGAFARTLEDLLHVRAPAVLGGDIEPQFSNLFPCLQEIDSDRAEVAASVFDDGNPTRTNPDLHSST